MKIKKSDVIRSIETVSKFCSERQCSICEFNSKDNFTCMIATSLFSSMIPATYDVKNLIESEFEND
ncbi:hypothetical protein [Clostridium cadaveris]|uniref:hypothetical protein n=1 Tax=Clostridium cadaveris TaxID=1529 RepID=UPI0015B73676|nr:hypothetical protein [Clostridium cadaveris]NWK11758.1 hypothetical protein [Clostridium cadaveris]